VKAKRKPFKEGDPPFILRVELLRDRIEDPSAYPFNLPVLKDFEKLELHPKVTYLVGENGSGKSTILEAIAVAAGFNPEGGTTNFNFSTRGSHSELYKALRLVRATRRPRTGYFLRAESFFNVASEIEALDREPAPAPPLINSYGGESLHEKSHGESFMALLKHRFGDEGLYILDEPEAALSPARQMAFLTRLHHLVSGGSQFVIATHAPIVLAYPDSRIYELANEREPIAVTPYDETSTVRVTRDFIAQRVRWLDRLCSP
jgi:predicted ATPase